MGTIWIRTTTDARTLRIAAVAVALSPLGAWAQRIAPVNVGGIGVVPALPGQVAAFKAFLETPDGLRFSKMYTSVQRLELAPESNEAQLFVGALRLPEALNFQVAQNQYLLAQKARSEAVTGRLAAARRDLARGRINAVQAEAAARQARSELAELPGLGDSIAADTELGYLEASAAAARQLELHGAAGRALGAAKAPRWHQSAFVGGDAATPLRQAALASQPMANPKARLSPWIGRGAARTMAKAIDAAHGEIEIAHPGIPLTPDIRVALARAAAKGKKVRLVSEWSEEGAEELQALERAGVTIRYMPGTPSRHTKFAIIDGAVWTPRQSVSGEFHWSVEAEKGLRNEFNVHMNSMWKHSATTTPAAAAQKSSPRGAAPAKKAILETLAGWVAPVTVVAGLAATAALAPTWGAAVIPAALFAMTMGLVGIAIMEWNERAAYPFPPLARLLAFGLLGGASALSPVLWASASVAQWVIVGLAFGLSWLFSLD